MDKILHQTVRLDCPVDRVFELFTESERVASWLAPKAEVEASVGGKYELYWDPSTPDDNSTKGCKVTAYEKSRLLAFEWKGPKPYKHFMNWADPKTHVVVSFFPSADGGSEIHLVHSGWRSGEEWEVARRWFEQAWRTAFSSLRTLVEKEAAR